MGNIVWLASYPKSGNTWVRAFLAQLIADSDRPLPLAALSRYCEDDARPEWYTQAAGRPSSELDFAQIGGLRPQVHRLIAAAAQGSRFVKTHSFAGSIDGLPMLTAEVTAAAVYIVRNPLDVAISMTQHFGLTIDEAIERLATEQLATQNDALFVSQFLGSWSMHVDSWASRAGPRWIVVRYEDLFGKPLKTFGKIAQLVGLGQDRARIERAIRHSSFATLAKAEREQGFVEATRQGQLFFRIGRINQWREALTRQQVARVVDAHRLQMQRYGYIPGGY